VQEAAMFGSELLEVAIGIIFVYILVSIICSAVREWIETMMKTRSAYLEHGIRELLHDADGTDLAQSLFKHPLIYGLFLDEYKPRPPLQAKTWWRPWATSRRPAVLAKGTGLPSYIPAKDFAIALMDLAARGRGTDPLTSGAASTPISTTSLRQNVTNLRNEGVQRVLLTALDLAGDDLKKVQENLERWYDSGMDRVSGWYKRSTQWIVLVIGFAVAVTFNVNTITIAEYLYRNDAERQALVARAEAAARDSSFVTQEYAAARAALDSLSLPVGWNDTKIDAGLVNSPKDFWFFVIIPLLGWLLTGMAATLGAPFWFDVLNKVMVIRSTVKPREKSPEEASEDRQLKPARATTPAAEAEQPAPAVGGGGAGGGAAAQPPGGIPPRAQLPEAGVDADPGDAESDVDACDIEFEDETPDELLPLAEGGVAR
jgi:hypothetical protein